MKYFCSKSDEYVSQKKKVLGVNSFSKNWFYYVWI